MFWGYSYTALKTMFHKGASGNACFANRLNPFHTNDIPSPKAFKYTHTHTHMLGSVRGYPYFWKLPHVWCTLWVSMESCTATLKLRLWWYPYFPHHVPFWYSSTNYDCMSQDIHFADLILACCQGCLLLWLQDQEYLGVRRSGSGLHGMF